MNIEDFSFNLPEELIAQQPCEPRENSRMMIVDRSRQSIECRHFYNLADYFDCNDLLVVNESKVIPARLYGTKITGGSVEILLLSRVDNGPGSHQQWEVLLRPGKRVKPGTIIVFDDNSRAEIVRRVSDKKWVLSFHSNGDFDSFLTTHGSAPLPPYIKRKKHSPEGIRDLKRYQTVYATMPGSVAAPTAGLHFSPAVLKDLENKGTRIAPITLHVGYGTFLPIEAEFVEDHVMEREFYEIDGGSARAINGDRRITAVGTTSTRVLESVSDGNGTVPAAKGWTDLFIYPGYRFKKVDRLITNFHLPRSSLFLLVCAFAGKDLITEAYETAIRENFRFYSYGDCMIIV
ncbi:MAG: tRNA preQ1(34) S-adenosylmethionine ribosyltransferase-isomerase QueA [Deltaproteobacteria bacterium]|nr:tRNA preQ1(34) S-adenosylmethionine ribosyltransferase-isomerase QueA [Deltaproteobacteria bacterium]